MQPGLPFEAPREVRNAGPGPGSRPEDANGANAHPIFVRHPRARRYIIRVRDDGTVRVTIPRGGSKREAQAFARAQWRWVERQLERLVRDRTETALPTPAACADRDLLNRARRELPARLMELAHAHGLTVGRVSVRDQRSRWGSCSPSGHICLNWRLVQLPANVRDYVLIHELMHLKRLDHSQAFWALVATACPDYRAARAWLRRAHAWESAPRSGRVE